MKLSEYKQAFYDVSTKASDRTRTAAIGGIGIIWVFKLEAGPYPQIPASLLVPIGAFAFSLLCDLLQYAVGSLIWFCFHWCHERKLSDVKTEDPELDHSAWLTLPINLLFVVKIMAVVVGYVMMAGFLWQAWGTSSVR